jgi:hypothetical protein
MEYCIVCYPFIPRPRAPFGPQLICEVETWSGEQRRMDWSEEPVKIHSCSVRFRTWFEPRFGFQKFAYCQ